MVGRKFGLPRYDSLETLTGSSLHPGTGGETGVGEGQLAVKTADWGEDHPTFSLATLATTLVHLRHLP